MKPVRKLVFSLLASVTVAAGGASADNRVPRT